MLKWRGTNKKLILKWSHSSVKHAIYNLRHNSNYSWEEHIDSNSLPILYNILGFNAWTYQNWRLHCDLRQLVKHQSLLVVCKRHSTCLCKENRYFRKVIKHSDFKRLKKLCNYLRVDCHVKRLNSSFQFYYVRPESFSSFNDMKIESFHNTRY